MDIKETILECVGGTPMVRLQKLGGGAQILVKVEAANPGGSAKDRIALAMIRGAEARGELAPGGTIIEPTSGNTGVGLAMVSTVLGYHLILTMPDTMSIERRRLAAAYGAEVVLTPGAEGMRGAIAKAEALRAEIPGSIILQQFTNPDNAPAHEQTTGPEIWQQTAGAVDAVVAGVGTGGTLTGVARYLRSVKSDIGIYAVEPDTSAVLSGGAAGAHKLQGIGAGFVPVVTDARLFTEVMPIGAEEAFAAARDLARKEGILCGISGGAALAAALKLAERAAFAGKTIVVILPDTGERYLSSELWAE